MKPMWLILAAALAALLVLTVLLNAAQAGAQERPAALEFQATPPGPPAPHREIVGGADAPTISFIDNPNPTCYQTKHGSGVCYITWSALEVTATSGQNIISMTVSLDGRIQAYHSGFFQTNMYVPGALYGPGFKVWCGWTGENPSPNLGRTYSYVVRARETGGLTAANYGSVTCPVDPLPVFIPFVRR